VRAGDGLLKVADEELHHGLGRRRRDLHESWWLVYDAEMSEAWVLRVGCPTIYDDMLIQV